MIKNYLERASLESQEKWGDIIKEIPSLKFKEHWEVKIIPPYAGAVARFTIYKNNKQVCSVYLDWHGNLGAVNVPYYELYPNEDDETNRYLLNETEELLSDINRLWNTHHD